MKKMILLTMVLLAIVSGQVFAANRQVSINFAQSTNQVFSGGQLIGPYATDSSNWNNSGGNIPNGSMSELIDSEGDDTGINVSWTSANCWSNSDGTADDEHKLAVGYLDDGGAGVLVTLSNIPYDTYQIVGLYTSGQGDTQTINFDVNGTFSLGGDASTIADTYGSINSCNTNTGSYWTQIETGVTRGNYWVVDATGSTCTINGEARNGSSRGSLAGVIIISDSDQAVVVPPVQRSISVNYNYNGYGDSYARNDELHFSTNPAFGYTDPNGILLKQIPTATWNEGSAIQASGVPMKVKDHFGAVDSGYLLNSNDFDWHGPSWLIGIDGFYDGTAVGAAGGEKLEDAINKLRISQGFIGQDGRHPSNVMNKLTSIVKNPYSDYSVVAYLHANQNGNQHGIQIEDQSFYYLAELTTDFLTAVGADPNNSNRGWILATETTSPATMKANVAVFQNLSDPDVEIFFQKPTNSGICAFSVISNVDVKDIATQVSPGNTDKSFGDTPISITSELVWDAPVNGADSYNVYLGLYAADAEDPNFYLVESGNTTGSYTPALDYGLTYVWRVDTVRGGETISGDYWYFDVEGDPIIQNQPNSVSVKAGSDTSFTVGALLTDNYEWWYSADAAVDTPEDDVLLQSGPDATVNVLNATDGVNAGYYYVVLTNNISGSASVVSDVASLEIGKLEVYLPFDGDPNDVFLDASGNGWNADYGNVGPDPIDPNLTAPTMGTVSFQTGYDGVGQAVKFTRGSGDQLVIPGSDDYFNFYPKGFTIRFWVKPVYGQGGYVTYISKSSNAGNPPATGWRMFDEAEYAGQGLSANMSPLGVRNTPLGRLDDGNWHMIACTYDGATQEMKVYQEGFLQGTSTGTLGATTSYPVVIGNQYNTGTGGWGYEGLIDDVEIFSYAVSERDMLKDYAAKTGEVYCSGGGSNVGDLVADCVIDNKDFAKLAETWMFESDTIVLSEAFDANDPGTNVADWDGWDGWDGDINAGALISDVQAYSGTNSLEIKSGVDLVPSWTNLTAGKWVCSIMTYIPSNVVLGSSDISAMSSVWPDPYEGWSPVLTFDFATDVTNGGLPLVRDQWVPMQIVYDYDAETPTASSYYNGELNSTGDSPGSVGLDLWANGHDEPIYYDDIRVFAQVEGDLNYDGNVDLADLHVLIENWLADNRL